MQHRALNHALKTDRGLGVDLTVGGKDRHVLVEEPEQVAAQLVDIAPARANDTRRAWVVEQRQHQMLDRNKLMAPFPRGLESGIQRKFKFLRKHCSTSTPKACNLHTFIIPVPRYTAMGANVPARKQTLVAPLSPRSPECRRRIRRCPSGARAA